MNSTIHSGRALVKGIKSTGRVTMVERSAGTYRIGSIWTRGIRYAPFVLLGGSFLFLLSATTRPATLWMLEEDHPVEMLTFLSLFAGSLISLWLARALRAGGENALIYGFYVVFSIGLFLIAMEEIAWGQRLLGFRTPQSILAINRQGETTFHNIGALQGKSEWMRLVFGLGGIVGVGLSRLPALAKIGVPAILLPWFLLITGHTAIDAYNDFFPIQAEFDFIMQRTSEVVELLIGIAGLLYVLMKFRTLVPPVPASRPATKAS